MRILVTGGAGFIGANVCRELVGHPGVSVVVLDDLSTGFADNLDGVPAELVIGSIMDRRLLGEVSAGADAVIHLAARPSVPRSIADPMLSHEINATGTANVLEACRSRSIPIVVASSSSVYGATPGLPRHEDMPTRPLSPYAASKLAAESYALSWASSFGLPVMALRFFNVYGPYQRAGHAYAAVIPAFVDAILRDEPVLMHGDGGQTRDFTYVATVARVLAIAALGRVTSDEPVNLAFGSRLTVRDLAELIAVRVGRPLRVTHLPPRPGDVRDSQAADERLRRLFPGVAPMPLAEGLDRTLEWFLAQPDYAGTLTAALR
ncbi:UDP-glucose 4-epimerase [Allocatelliglobosispora scoriae]|uniref:UDP-glucose 4-epimerase n=1 Tax=Allocatelliglobosispora scoriae TaxID=643052 RepID=A0A841BSX5_9ACTN|nr:NAD-dependent epimerase/dehydratase family protein [Allocatelliglobosispora scoriae]MBB5870805.1 UDP-glucose 4-epimerase [Allocatelliglobosispora scoriae]